MAASSLHLSKRRSCQSLDCVEIGNSILGDLLLSESIQNVQAALIEPGRFFLAFRILQMMVFIGLGIYECLIVT